MGVWKHMTKIKLLVCLFWQSFTITFRLRVFVFFALVAFSSLLKIKGCHVFLGFSSFGCFWVSFFDVFGFPYSKGDCIGFLSVNGVGACAAFWGVSPSLLCISGCFPSLSFVPLSSLHTPLKKIYTPTYHVNSTHITQKYTHLHTRYPPYCL